ncbi:MAG: hypothetical protein IPG21_09655 [Saprospiraceae bacterium]|nr:hypothetical protein [Candidatus Vicinibacter affinis]
MHFVYDISILFASYASRKFVAFIWMLCFNLFFINAQETNPPLLLECIFKDSSIQRFYKNDQVWITFRDARKSPIPKAQLQNPFKLNSLHSNEISITSSEGYQYTIPQKEFKGLGKVNPTQTEKISKNKLNGLGIAGIILTILSGLVFIGASAQNDGGLAETANAGCLNLIAIPVLITGVILFIVGLTTKKPITHYNDPNIKMILFDHPDCKCKTIFEP